MSHGLDPSQVYVSCRKALASGMVAPLTEAQIKPVKFTRFDAVGSDMMEIVVGDVWCAWAVIRALRAA